MKVILSYRIEEDRIAVKKAPSNKIITLLAPADDMDGGCLGRELEDVLGAANRAANNPFATIALDTLDIVGKRDFAMGTAE